MITRENGFPPTYPTRLPEGMWNGRSGKASWLRAQGPVYDGMVRWAAVPFSPGRARVEMDPSDPSTWQRPYIFTQ